MMQSDSLPSFSDPPVTEVVLGVQFNSIQGFLSPHLGLAWNSFRHEYPGLEEHPPLMPVFEMFGTGSKPEGGMPFLMPFGPPRVFFISRDNSALFQLQADRLLHNWRKYSADDIYPRFEPLLENFEIGYARLQATLLDSGLGAILPNQCEISYINHLLSPSIVQTDGLVAGLYNGLGEKLDLQNIGRPEDVRFMFRYTITNDVGAPKGRLIVTADPVFGPDGQTALQLSLTVRGRPTTADLSGVTDFLKVGRAHIVKSFAELTDKNMHEKWGRIR